MLALVAAAETGSEHPVADAIVAAARERDLQLEPVEQFEAIPGHGIDATVAGRRVRVGNAALMAQFGIGTADLDEVAATAAASAQTPMFVSVDDELVARRRGRRPGQAGVRRGGRPAQGAWASRSGC